MSAAVVAGTVWVNCFYVRDLETPFGGARDSGIGREGGHHSFDFYCDVKTVCERVSAFRCLTGPASSCATAPTAPPGSSASGSRRAARRSRCMTSDGAGAGARGRRLRRLARLGASRPTTPPSRGSAAELELLREAVAAAVPVLGLCFGGQALSIALGGEVRPRAAPQIGWFELPARSEPRGPVVSLALRAARAPPAGAMLARSEVGPVGVPDRPPPRAAVPSRGDDRA